MEATKLSVREVAKLIGPRIWLDLLNTLQIFLFCFVGDDGFTQKEREQLNITSAAFEALERGFKEVLNEVVGGKSLEKFRQEYEKLHWTLKKSHENEKRLIKKCRDLNSEIVANAAKIQTALRLSVQDQTRYWSRPGFRWIFPAFVDLLNPRVYVFVAVC